MYWTLGGIMELLFCDDKGILFTKNVLFLADVC